MVLMAVITVWIIAARVLAIVLTVCCMDNRGEGTKNRVNNSMDNRSKGTDNRVDSKNNRCKGTNNNNPTSRSTLIIGRTARGAERAGGRVPAGEDVAERVRFGPRHLIALRPLEALHHLVPVQMWQG